MISLLTCCKTHQSVIEKSTTIAKDTTTISQIAAKDSTSLNAKIDSIIIEDYNQEKSITESVSQKEQKGYIGSWQKRNDISQKESIPPKRKTKIYGVNLSGTWLSINDSINKKMSHQQTTNSDIKQKTPIQTTTGSKIIFILIGITLLLFAGYVVWKNAVQ